MKILITGGLGFIGAHLANALSNHDITILDKYDLNYIGFAKIYRGQVEGIVPISEIEEKHRKLNVQYRISLIKNINIIRKWSFEYLPTDSFDLIINCGGLSEAVLSKFFGEFCYNSIVEGYKNIKATYSCPTIHISSSMVYGSWKGKITELNTLNPVDYYGICKAKAEGFIDENDIVLRPIHVYGIGDAKFPIWMNIERQINKNQPVNVEAADCIYIDDFVQIVKNILDSWKPGIYNISSNYIRNGKDLQKVYPKHFKIKEKLGPTGKPRGSLNSSKLFETFNVKLQYNNYLETIQDYYNKYENLCKE